MVSRWVWRHVATGGEYVILAEALEEATQRPVTVYRSLGTGITWTRPRDEFNARFERLRPFMGELS